MKDRSARWAEEGSRAKFRFLRSLPGRGYCALGTIHWFRLPFSIFYLEKDNRSMTPCQDAVSVLTEPSDSLILAPNIWEMCQEMPENGRISGKTHVYCS